MKLYRAINGLGDYWIVAKSFDDANSKLMALLNAGDGYGFSDKRIIQQIHLIAELATEDYLTNKFLVL